MFHFPHRTLFVQLSYLGKHRTQKFTYFAVCSMLFCEKKNLVNFFTPTFFQLFSCSKCRPCARTHALSLFLSLVNDVLLQTIPYINEALLQLIDVIQTAFASRCCLIQHYISCSRRRKGVTPLGLK